MNFDAIITKSILTALVALSITLNGVANAEEPALPHPEHVVVVIEENHSFSSVIGNPDAPFINGLAQQGALFTQSFALAHPSQPNYIMLISGSNQGVTDNGVPKTLPFTTPNLGAQLIAAGLTFRGYSEGLPAPGFDGAASGRYVRKHNSWVNWQDAHSNGIPRSSNLPFSAWPTDLNRLPTVAYVVPDLDHDMHDGTIAQADAWLKDKLGSYTQWATNHNSLLICTFDEDDSRENQRIPTFFFGPMVRADRYDMPITHYEVLRAIESFYGLPPIGAAADAKTLTVWR